MRIVLVSQDALAGQMAGPAIRYWELAHHLADRGHEVRLLAPHISVRSQTVELATSSMRELRASGRNAQAVLSQVFTPADVIALRNSAARKLLDAYDPVILESLQHDSNLKPAHYRAVLRTHVARTKLSLAHADALVCASERQRDLWLGALMISGRLSAEAHADDASLRTLVGVVPFGMPAAPPRRQGEGPRARFSIPETAIVALWGGGLWDWLDPAAVIFGLAKARLQVPALHLVFMGTKRPSAAPLGASRAIQAALAAATETGLLDNAVFFTDDWTPYEQRAAYLLDADIGVSSHFEQVETRFAFRTRVLDYLWAGLPCILTEGDTLSDLVSEAGAGLTVRPADTDGWSSAFVSMSDPLRRARSGRAAARLAPRFHWSRSAEALESMCFGRPRVPRAGGLRASDAMESARYWAAAAIASSHQGRLKDARVRLRAPRS